MSGIAKILEQGAVSLNRQQLADLILCERTQERACRNLDNVELADQHAAEIERLTQLLEKA